MLVGGRLLVIIDGRKLFVLAHFMIALFSVHRQHAIIARGRNGLLFKVQRKIHWCFLFVEARLILDLSVINQFQDALLRIKDSPSSGMVGGIWRPLLVMGSKYLASSYTDFSVMLFADSVQVPNETSSPDVKDCLTQIDKLLCCWELYFKVKRNSCSGTTLGVLGLKRQADIIY